MFEKEFTERLKELYQSGKTYDEIVSLTGLSRSAIARVINGSRPPKNLSVDALVKAFPNASIVLNGGNFNTGGVVGNISGGENFLNAKSDESVLEKIRELILDSEDLSAEEKIKFLKIIRGV